MTTLHAYVGFDGNCAEAMRFYEKVLDAKVEMMMTVGESPDRMGMPPEQHDKVMHAMLQGNGFALMGADAIGQPYSGIQGVGLALTFDTVAQARRVFDALAAGGKVTMPLEETFWSEIFGMVTDRYGVMWMVNGPYKAFN